MPTIAYEGRILFVSACFHVNEEVKHVKHCDTIRVQYLGAITTHILKNSFLTRPFVVGKRSTYADFVLYMDDEKSVQNRR
jgi:hypothetical protein